MKLWHGRLGINSITIPSTSWSAFMLNPENITWRFYRRVPGQGGTAQYTELAWEVATPNSAAPKIVYDFVTSDLGKTFYLTGTVPQSGQWSWNQNQQGYTLALLRATYGLIGVINCGEVPQNGSRSWIYGVTYGPTHTDLSISLIDSSPNDAKDICEWRGDCK